MDLRTRIRLSLLGYGESETTADKISGAQGINEMMQLLEAQGYDLLVRVVNKP